MAIHSTGAAYLLVYTQLIRGHQSKDLGRRDFVTVLFSACHCHHCLFQTSEGESQSDDFATGNQN